MLGSGADAPPRPSGAAPPEPATPSLKPDRQRSHTSATEPPLPGRPGTSKATTPSLRGRPRGSEPTLAAPGEILVGVNAKWVPDDPVVEPEFPDVPPPAAPAADDGWSTLVESPARPPGEPPAARTAAAQAVGIDIAPATGGDASALADLRQRKRARQRRMTIVAIGVVASLALGAYLLLPRTRPVARTAPGPANPDVGGTPQAADGLGPYSRATLESNLGLLDEFRPTQGQPVGMRYVPNGVNLVIHLRPADLWSDDRAAAELRASLTEGVVAWLETQIRAVCRREPAQVAEATFVGILGAFGTEPRWAVVVRLKEPVKPSQLLEEFQGRLVDDETQPPITVSGQTAHVLVDSQTFAIAPADTSLELQDALAEPNGYVSRNLADLLKQSDRERLLTIAVELPDLRRHSAMLFSEPVRPAVEAFVDWLGNDVEAVLWSLHTRPALHSELVVRPQMGVSPTMLRASLQKRLAAVPPRMVEIVKTLSPRQQGFREIVGRFPAMLEAVNQATVMHVAPQQVRLTTVLPARAAPNLALGTLLTWDELRRGETSPAEAAPVATSGDTRPIAERLRKPILAEFQGMSIEQAVIYIGEQTGVNFAVDGEALEMTGYTRNMPQKLSLGEKPAIEALRAIVTVPDQSDLAVFVDERANRALMSTKPYLEQRGQKPFPLE
ncbi:MAG: hypothetical protein KF774_12995 [Planctomyces sp.]|nr:hypothetical protein [Planctomyces sp.]